MANFIGQQIKLTDIQCDDRLKIDLNNFGNKKQFHADLENIRQWRKENVSVLEQNPVGIDVLWKNNGQKEHIFVVVTTSKFLVIGYVNSNGYVSFGSEDDLSYEGHANGEPSLNIYDVYNYLEVLSQWSGGMFLHYDNTIIKNKPILNREAFLICVFLASEMVRNEILEIIFLYDGLFKKRSWGEYKLLYKNWEKISKIINDEKGTYIKTITAVAVLKKLWANTDKGILDDRENEFEKLYRDYMKTIQESGDEKLFDIYFRDNKH